MKIWWVLSFAILVYGGMIFLSEGILLPDFKLVLILTALTIINYFVRGWRWQILLKHFNMKISFWESAKTYIAGLFFILTPAKSGEVLKSELMKRRYGFSRKKTAFLTLVERAFDIIAHLILASVSAALIATAYLKNLLIISALGAVGMVGLFVFRHKLSFIKEELEQLGDIRLISKSILLSLLAWSLEIYEITIASNWFGFRIGFFKSAFVFSSSLIFGNLLMLPGGLGAAEAGMTGLFLFLGMSKATANSITILIRFTTFWIGFLLGMIFWFFLFRKNVK